MKRRAFLSGAAALLAAPLAAEGQQAGKVPRVGVLTFAESPSLAGFREGLRALGWNEGLNIGLEVRFAGGSNERYRELAQDLVRLKVDVLAAVSSQAVQAAKEQTRTIPVVMLMVSDPVGAGFVASPPRPGGNITGVSTQLRDLTGKTLELLREVAPGTRRVAEIWDPTNASSTTGHRETELVAAQMGMQVISVPIRQPADIEPALAGLNREQPGALIVHPNPSVWQSRTAISQFALKQRLPSISGPRVWTEAGLLMSYGPSPFAAGRHAAQYVDKILKGAKPSDLPVEQPTKFELVINLKTAKALGLTIPPSLLARADQVIE
jgi:putative ABC transport system substrate-binding protein